ncbi:hypothetical protein ANAEL_01184 [Anaerolineales bacterium]|nr:hypothetical protein ANAEL_01184 [Anaerolineales bacterium]
MASEKNFGTRVKSFLAQPRLILNSLLLFVFSAAWIREVLYWFPRDAFGTSLNYWAYTDWLIDYSQGFIRRGLSGEIWRLVPAVVPPLEFVTVFSWALILTVAFGYVRLLARSWKIYHPLTLFGLLFLPSLFVFYLHDHNAIARKEILGYVTVLLHLLIVEKSFPLGDSSTQDRNLRHYVQWLIPVAVVLLPAIILIHEGNFLMFAPLHGMITLTILRMKSPRDFTRAALWTGLLYLPATIAVGAVYLAGTPSHRMLLGICQKWNAVGAIREGSCILTPEKLTGSTLPGSFIPMEWSLAIAADITRMVISMNWESWILILPTLGISLWYLVRQAVYSILRSRSPQSFSPQSARWYSGLFFRKYFLIPFLLSLPVYFTAYDYGRWFTVTCINFSMVAVSVNLPCWEFALRKEAADEGPTAIDSPEHLDHRLIFHGASIIICILALVLWLPHYCLFRCEIIRSPLQFFSHTFFVH